MPTTGPNTKLKSGLKTSLDRELNSGRESVEHSYDVIVIGSGVAGLVSAIRSAQSGLRVLVLEKAEKLGGTSAVGGGVMWSPNSHLMAAGGYADSEQQAADYLQAAAGEEMSPGEIEWYVKTSPRAVRFLDERTRVRLTPLARPDYHMDWPGAASGGRGLDNEPFDPGECENLAESLRLPTYFPLLTMNERDALKGSAPNPALLKDRAARGVRTMGGALVGALVASALEAGVDIVANARVSELLPVDSNERGDSLRWSVSVDDIEIDAGSVVIASGGFEWNRQLATALLKFPVVPISAPSNEGDGLMLGLGAGAGLDEMTAIWGVPVIAPPRARYDGKPSGRMGNVEMTLPGSITVNSKGRRFVNEAMNYHDLTRVFANIDPLTSTQENNPAWMLFDNRYLGKYPIAGSIPGKSEDWMIRAGSLPELARAIGVEPAALEKTVTQFNADAEIGEDTEFGRGSTEQDRHLGDPANEPNPCLAPLAEAPYFAIPIHAGVLGTAGGLKVNLDGQALDKNDRPIDGLYAAGNCAATVFRDAYPGGGATLGSAITRAFAVGEHIAAHSPIHPQTGPDAIRHESPTRKAGTANA